MKEKPVLFSGPMVRAILDGRKIQTRRVVKYEIRGPNPPGETFDWMDKHGEWIAAHGTIKFSETSAARLCPYGKPGDRLWVRETWRPTVIIGETYTAYVTEYRADGEWQEAEFDDWEEVFDDRRRDRWRPSIHMPRWASRITLEVIGVRVERVQEITNEDAKAEGVTDTPYPMKTYKGWADGVYTALFHDLWDSINAKRGYSWEANPWCWVVEFRRIEG